MKVLHSSLIPIQYSALKTARVHAGLHITQVKNILINGNSHGVFSRDYLFGSEAFVFRSLFVAKVSQAGIEG